MDVVPRGMELELQLRRGVGQAAHICNNLHVKSTGVYLGISSEKLLQLNCIEFYSRDLGSLH